MYQKFNLMYDFLVMPTYIFLPLNGHSLVSLNALWGHYPKPFPVPNLEMLPCHWLLWYTSEEERCC